MRILAGFIFWVQVLHYYYHQYQLNGFVLHCSVRKYASRLCLKLCLTRKLGNVSLAFATFFCNESLLGAKRRVGCFFHDFKLLICAEVLQWILTSLKFWWCQEFYFFTGGTEKLVMITNSSFSFWMLTNPTMFKYNFKFKRTRKSWNFGGSFIAYNITLLFFFITFCVRNLIILTLSSFYFVSFENKSNKFLLRKVRSSSCFPQGPLTSIQPVSPSRPTFPP